MGQVLLALAFFFGVIHFVFAAPMTAGYIQKANSGTVIVDSMIYQSGSNIGINTVSPAATLEVNGNVIVDGSVYSTALTVSGTGSSYFTNSLGIGTISPQTTLDVQAPAGSNIARFGVSNSSSMLIDNNGRVGIGTTTLTGPKLVVMGGNVGIGTTTASAALAVLSAINVMTTGGANVAWNMYSDSTGAFLEGKVSGSNKVVINTKGVSYINSGFNVGIGTTAPSELLEVDGGIYPRGGNYYSSDHSVGVTVTTCTGFKNGLCISGT